MRRRTSTLLAAGSMLFIGAPNVASTVSAYGITAHMACTRATTGGQSKCIARGQFCARAHASDYRRSGLSCSKRDANGRYHLQ